MRRLVVLALGLVLVATVTPALAAPPPLHRQLLVFSYDGLGPALLSVQGTVEAKGRPGYLASVVADQFDGGALQPFFPDLTELGEASAPPRVYGAPGSRDVCASPVVACTAEPGSSTLDFSVSFSVGRSSRPTHVRLFMAMEGTSVTADDASLGWKLRKQAGGFARALGGGTGGRAFGTSVEALPEAALPGGRRGSIAIAVPPCEDGGAGTVTLSGGTNATPTVCPASPFADAAAKGTRWSLSGLAAGVSAFRTRLLVIDL